jgi:hypothetical protein
VYICKAIYHNQGLIRLHTCLHFGKNIFRQFFYAISTQLHKAIYHNQGSIRLHTYMSILAKMFFYAIVEKQFLIIKDNFSDSCGQIYQILKATITHF